MKSTQHAGGSSLISLGIAGLGDSTRDPEMRTPLESKLWERYGLRENPFGNSPDPRYLYQSVTHREALSSLRIGIECGIGFQTLVASPGMGKTTLLFHLLSRFSPVARTAFLFQVQGDSRDFLRNLLLEMGSDADGSDLVSMQEKIRQVLVCEARAGRRTILVIDEAQGLETSVLETIRMLSNFELPNRKLLQIILAGQPQLAETLARPELAQLYQRICISTRIAALEVEESKQYIAHRLEIAGYKGSPLFTENALRLVWKTSCGIPRTINRLCFNALLAGASKRWEQFDAELLQGVIADLDLDDSFSSASSNVQVCTEGKDGLKTIVRRIQAVTGAEAVAISLLDGNGMVCRARVGNIAPPLGFRANAGNGLTGQCIRSGQILRCNNSEGDRRVDLEVCRQVGIKSIIGVPLRDDKDIIGMLGIFSAETNAFSSLNLSVLHRLGSDVVATFGRTAEETSEVGLGDTSIAHTLPIQQRKRFRERGAIRSRVNG